MPEYHPVRQSAERDFMDASSLIVEVRFEPTSLDDSRNSS
jgi:hypothetical protein